MFLNRHATFAAFALLLSLAGAGQDAQAFTMSTQTFLAGTQEQTTQTATSKASSSQADANNFAVARVDAAAGTVGVEAVTGVAQSIAAGAALSDQWGCVGCDASASSLRFQVDLEGILGPNVPDEGPNDGFSGNFEARGVHPDNSFWDISLSFAWNGSSLSGVECSTASNGGTFNTLCDPLTLATTSLPDGSTVIHATLSLITPCAFPTLCAISGNFTTSLSLDADFDPAPGPISVDALNTFGFNVYSADPGIVWASDSGRTSIAEVSAVPEPGSALLLVVSLGAMALLRRAGSKNQLRVTDALPH